MKNKQLVSVIVYNIRTLKTLTSTIIFARTVCDRTNLPEVNFIIPYRGGRWWGVWVRSEMRNGKRGAVRGGVEDEGGVTADVKGGKKSGVCKACSAH